MCTRMNLIGNVNVLVIQEVGCTGQSRKVFRQVSHDASGAGMEPSEGEVMFFGRDVYDRVVCVASLLLAEPKPEMWDDDDETLTRELSEDWDAEIASSCTTVREWECCSGNKLSFLFVSPRYQRRGYGGQMLEFVEKYTWATSDLPMKLETCQ